MPIEQHEMIHAYVFVATPVRDHEDHGPLFQAHMNRINVAAQTKITVFHTFHDEVDSYRQHVWQCNVSLCVLKQLGHGCSTKIGVVLKGPCRRTQPYFGLVKRSMNRAPGPTDRWWADHEQSCGGSYSKIKEPAEFTAKQAKKKGRELAREEKQKKKKKDKEVNAAPSVKQFFPTIKEDVDSDKSKKPARGDAKPLRGEKKTLHQPGTENDNKKKRKKEHEDDSNSSGWPMLAFPTSAPVIFSAVGDEDGYFLVGDIQALFQTSPSQPSNLINRKGDRQEPFGELQAGQGTFSAANRTHTTGSSAVVDLTVSDSDASDNEQLGKNISLATLPRATADGLQTTTRTSDADVIEIE